MESQERKSGQYREKWERDEQVRRACIKKFCCKREKRGWVVAKGRSLVKRRDCYLAWACFILMERPLGVGVGRLFSDHISTLSWWARMPLQAQTEGPFSSVMRGQGRREAGTGSSGSWRAGSWAISCLIVSIFFVEQGRLSAELEENGLRANGDLIKGEERFGLKS